MSKKYDKENTDFFTQFNIGQVHVQPFESVGVSLFAFVQHFFAHSRSVCDNLFPQFCSIGEVMTAKIVQ